MKTMTGEADLNFNNAGGYDVEFVDQTISNQNLKCSICLLVLREPMQAVPCGHRFCKSCIDLEKERLNKEKLVCPNDRMAIQVFPDVGREREILELQAKCSNGDPTKCQWNGELRYFEEHLKECLFQLLECKMKCGQKNILRKHMALHLEDECPKNLDDCPFSSVGCLFQGKKIELEKHMETSTTEHLLFQNQRILALEENLSNEKRESDKMKMEIAGLKRKNRESEDDVARLRREVGELSSRLQLKCPFTFVVKNVSSIIKNVKETKFRLRSEIFEIFKGYQGRLLVTFYMPSRDGRTAPVSQEDYIGVYLELVEGPFDDALEWPMLFDRVWFKCILNDKCVKLWSFGYSEEMKKIFDKPSIPKTLCNKGFKQFLKVKDIPKDLIDDEIKIEVDVTKAK